MGLFIDFGRGRACAGGNETTTEQELTGRQSTRTSDSERFVRSVIYNVRPSTQLRGKLLSYFTDFKLTLNKHLGRRHEASESHEVERANYQKTV